MIDVINIFKNNIKFVDYSRSGVIYYTENLDELYEFSQIGWNYNICSKGYRLIPPTTTICDITECKKVEQYKNIVFNITYFDYIKELIKKNKINFFIDSILASREIYYKNFVYHVSVGPILEAEVKIEGIDNRVESLKSDMLKKFILSDEYSRRYNENKLRNISNTFFTKKQIKNQKTLKIFSDIEKINSTIRKVEIPKTFYQVDKKIFDNIEYDILLFIPYGCYKFLNIFLDDTNYHKLMFWELHIDDSKPNFHKIFSKKMNNKKVLIIDSVYSGKTLLKMKKIVEEAGGIPIILGIAPKSISVLNILDYALILDKIYEVSKMKIDNDLFRKIYYDSIRRISENV
jgi:hypothetical protein